MGLQKLGITLAEQCARYAKACGKSSILCTKPVHIQSVDRLRYAKELKYDVAKFETKEIKLDSGLFNFLPWRKNGYKKLPPTGMPPKYTPEAKQATELFINKGWIEEPLPDGFRIPFGPYRAFDENGMFKQHLNSLTDHEFLYLNKNSKGIRLMVERLKKLFSNNPNITEEQKAKILHKFVDSCYDRNRASWVAKFSHHFIPIENTAASGAGVCRHKAFLTKALGDELGLHVAMARGWYVVNPKLEKLESHIWNEIKIGEKWFLMDVEQGRFVDLSEYSDFDKLYKYSH